MVGLLQVKDLEDKLAKALQANEDACHMMRLLKAEYTGECPFIRDAHHAQTDMHTMCLLGGPRELEWWRKRGSLDPAACKETAVLNCDGEIKVLENMIAPAVTRRLAAFRAGGAAGQKD